MYIPLQLRLSFFYAFVLGLALWFFGQIVYSQAEQRAYQDLDSSLSNRAASVRLGKDLFNQQPSPDNLPRFLAGVDSLGAQGVSIEVLDARLRLIATTDAQNEYPVATAVDGLGNSPIPWDARAAHEIAQHPLNKNGAANNVYSTILYAGQHVRVYTLGYTDFPNGHVIQTARSERDIEQSLADLRRVLLGGGAVVLAFALLGGWLITWGVLLAVKRMIRTAQRISKTKNFSQRVVSTSGLLRDELASLADALNEMLTNLEGLYYQQQRFVADASHELRAPITSIRCNLDLLAQAPDLPAREAQAALADAQGEADRMGRLVSDLLILARADATAQKQSGTPPAYKKRGFEKLVDLDSLLLEVFRQYRPAGELDEPGSRGQGPRLSLLHTTPAQVFGDADQLKQVLIAMLDNAFKYTPDDGSVFLSLHTLADQAVLKVKDTGIGIASNDLPHIFERFYRADRARSRHHGGSGLGLSIAQSIVKEHRGTIEVESVAGKGSTFTVSLPLALT
jgi:two-component system OmpR family sensor kinase